MPWTAELSNEGSNYSSWARFFYLKRLYYAICYLFKKLEFFSHQLENSGNETVSYCLLLRIARMEMDCILNKLAQLFQVLMLCLHHWIVIRFWEIAHLPLPLNKSEGDEEVREVEVTVLVLSSQCWQIRLFRTLWKKPHAAQKYPKRRDFFNDACGIAQNLTYMYCLSTYVPEKCLLMPLFLLYAAK